MGHERIKSGLGWTSAIAGVLAVGYCSHSAIKEDQPSPAEIEAARAGAAAYQVREERERACNQLGFNADGSWSSPYASIDEYGRRNNSQEEYATYCDRRTMPYANHYFTTVNEEVRREQERVACDALGYAEDGFLIEEGTAPLRYHEICNRVTRFMEPEERVEYFLDKTYPDGTDMTIDHSVYYMRNNPCRNEVQGSLASGDYLMGNITEEDVRYHALFSQRGTGRDEIPGQPICIVEGRPRR